MKKREFNFLIFSLALLQLVTGEEVTLKELTLQVNTNKLLSVSGDKFLSLTIDPLIILKSNDDSTNYERSIQMARALSPAYLRLGGPQSNSYLLDDSNNTDNLFSENNWRRLNQWAEKTGLDVVACISPRLMANDSQVDLVSLTDRMGFNASWQLGYECQTRCNFSGTDVGRYVQILRNKLNAIPRYSNSIITGPDVLDYQTEEQREYLEKFFTETEESLTAVTWHPDFTNVIENEDGVVFVDNDKLISDKNNLYEILGQDVAKKSLWIAESKGEPRKNQFIGALAWTNRLGNTAKLGIEVLMRQPVDLSKPTPDYWVSVLHKKLVGREILDTRIQMDNESHVHFYVQCTKASAIYQRGALTIFGINLTPMKIRANVKGFKIKNLHEYILTPGFDTENPMYAKTVLLNGKPLSLFKDTELPLLEPVIYNNEKGLSIELSSGGIGFWVVPDQKISSCMDHKIEKENVIVKTLIKENEILRKKRLIDYDQTIKRNKNKKWRSLAKRELNVDERKLHEKFVKVFPRKLAQIERKRSTMSESIRRSNQDFDKFSSDFLKTDQKYDRRRIKRSWIVTSKKNEGKNTENNLYGFSTKEEEKMKNLPNVDVLLQIDDSTRKNMDYDYTKKEKEIEEKGYKIVTIDHTKPENTWINVDNDYRDYMPNEIDQTTSIENVDMKENSNDYYKNIWQGENIQKHWINQVNNKEDNGKTKPVTNVASGVGEGRRIKENTVNMLMNYYSDSSASKSNQENLEESFRVKTQGSKLEDSFVASLGKTKLTLPEIRRRRRRRRRAMTTTIEEDKMTDLDVLHYSKSIGVPMNIPTYIDSKQAERSKRKVTNMDTILEKEMIDEDEANSKDCKCRVIRNFNDNSKFNPCKVVKRRANKNYKVTTESGKRNIENNTTEQYEETTETGNKNVENYETEQYEETTESGNENIENDETEQYEETTESENDETEQYEETTESGHENVENYEAEQLEKLDEQLVESINSELDQMDDHETNDSSAMNTELRNQLLETLEDELNVSDDELETKKGKFFRGPSGQIKETKEEINYNKDSFEIIPNLSQNITSITKKETKTIEIGINERKRYDKDQVTFDKEYYALVDSKEEKNPWMFQYQRKSNENLRNVYQSKGKEILSDNSEIIRTIKIPIGYIYDESAKTMKSDYKISEKSDDIVNNSTNLKGNNSKPMREDLRKKIYSIRIIPNLIENVKKIEDISEIGKNRENVNVNRRTRRDENTIPLSKDTDLMEKLDHILLDDNQFLQYNKLKENESTSSEELTKFDREILNNEINRDDSKLNVKHVYNYMKENDDKSPWKDIDRENLNKKSEILEEVWEFNPLSIWKEETNAVDNFWKDFSRHDLVMKNNGQRDQPNGGNNKSSFLRGSIPKLQEMITEGFDKAQNLTESSLKQVTDSIDKKFNETLPKDDKNNNILQNVTSPMKTENIFQSMITNLQKLFTFFFNFTRIFNDKL
ncbi:PREDICTED: uncharacterized protein LOC107069156 [Polistes dominula]|uniref:Uncharacterized protein LOC107069156 n=1 Tax=Polistes dominula TaxID=743375 RepID=A0ABM1IN94_POLDO|nr:PREDICTED: uncharacterized protein LOC107069156 [Polistes dominula]